MDDLNNVSDEQLKKLSTKDLEYLSAGQIDKISNAGLEILSPTPTPSGTTLSRGTSMVARGLASPTIGALGGAGLAAATFPPAIPVAAGIGTLAVPAADILTAGWNKLTPENLHVQYPSAAIQTALTKAGMPEPQNAIERSLVAGGGALGGTAGEFPAFAHVAQTTESPLIRGISENLSQVPARQLAVSAPSGAVGQYTYEKTDDPYLAALAGAATGAAGGIGATKAGLSQEQLAEQSQNLFRMARDSGITLKTKPFQASMQNIVSSLRSEGYTPTGNFPSVNAAVKELTKSNQPKDFTELQALRTIIANGQASADANERRVASILKEKFDDYVLNIPQRDINKGDTELGTQAWAEARNVYSRMKKAEIFEDIKSRAEMNATRYTQSGAENALVADLRNLANNKKKMRLFTDQEQQSIRDAVKGGNIQNVMRYLGKYAPTSPITAGSEAMIASLAGSQIGGTKGAVAGAALPVVGSAARVAATKMREKQLNDLIEIMRRGGQLPTTVSPTSTLGLRGLISGAQ